jgi:hypothetical protein
MVRPWVVCAEKGSMTNQRSFGRRGEPQRQPAPATGASQAVAPSPLVAATGRGLDRPVWPAEKPDFPNHDDDLRDWKLARQGFAVPWRQLSFMATLCFGIASLVLPDSVNDNVEWLLYALAAVSFYVGIRNRGRQAKI